MAVADGGYAGVGGRRVSVSANVGRLLGGSPKSLYVGISGVAALVFLLNRRFAELAVFSLAAVLVGGFVLAPSEVAGTVRDIWKTITG